MFGKTVAAGAFACVLAVATAHADDAAAAAQKQQEMEMWTKMAAPSEAHKELAKLAGTWNTVVTMWMEPGAEPQVSNGVSENKMVLDGRWLEQRYNGTFMGQPFQGVGFTGYDNFKKQYLGTWMDTASTSAMNTTGKREADGKLTFTGTMDDPMTGKSLPMKEVMTLVDADHHNFEMWMTGPDGKMMKTMEIQYTRKK
ncbi:MAG TPA: DUF1579 domain-containing protein [Thermoanaerobaculia bacterium]|jgi:hypothetical protein